MNETKNSPFWKRWGSKRRLSGLGAIALVIGLRLLGWLQPLEWKVFDFMLRYRPAESADERITIVAVDEPAIQALESYPIEDGQLADIIGQLNQYEPRAIGVDIFRDIPVGDGAAELSEIFQTQDNVFGIKRLLPPLIQPHPALPAERAGFVDQMMDADGFVRRNLLGTPNENGEGFFLSFTVLLAQAYLQVEGIELDNGIRDPLAMRFGEVEIRPWNRSEGGYVRADMGGYQIPVNFRSGSNAFTVIPLQQVLSGQVDPELLQDRLVLIGVTAPSTKDIVNSAAIFGVNPGWVSGIEFQAHAISQIIDAALTGRPLLQAWPNALEYSWIILWGVFGIALGKITRSPMQQLSATTAAGGILFGGCYGLLLLGFWIPFVPALLAFGFNSLVLYTFLVYDKGLRNQIATKQQVINRIYDQVHRKPLQDISALQRDINSDRISSEKVAEDLNALNQSIRDVFEDVQHSVLDLEETQYLNGDRFLPLDAPLNELLHGVYSKTLERDNLPCLAQIRLKLVEFKEVDETRLDFSMKREIGLFLEEMLCNIGKHATGATRLEITSEQQDNQNLIRVADNGSGQLPTGPRQRPGGRGTEQAQALARQLGGQFTRSQRHPKGVVCELSWPIVLPWTARFQQLWRQVWQDN